MVTHILLLEAIELNKSKELLICIEDVVEHTKEESKIVIVPVNYPINNTHCLTDRVLLFCKLSNTLDAQHNAANSGLQKSMKTLKRQKIIEGLAIFNSKHSSWHSQFILRL